MEVLTLSRITDTVSPCMSTHQQTYQCRHVTVQNMSQLCVAGIKFIRSEKYLCLDCTKVIIGQKRFTNNCIVIYTVTNTTASTCSQVNWKWQTWHGFFPESAGCVGFALKTFSSVAKKHHLFGNLTSSTRDRMITVLANYWFRYSVIIFFQLLIKQIQFWFSHKTVISLNIPPITSSDWLHVTIAINAE